MYGNATVLYHYWLDVFFVLGMHVTSQFLYKYDINSYWIAFIYTNMANALDKDCQRFAMR